MMISLKTIRLNGVDQIASVKNSKKIKFAIFAPFVKPTARAKGFKVYSSLFSTYKICIKI